MNPNTRYPSNPSSSNNRYFHNNNNNNNEEENLTRGFDQLAIGGSSRHSGYFDRERLGIPSRTSSAFSALESDRSLAVARPLRLPAAPPPPRFNSLPGPALSRIGANFRPSERVQFDLISRSILGKDDFSYEPDDLEKLDLPRDSFKYLHRLVTPEEISEWVRPPTCQEIAKQFLNPGCDLQDMHDLRNWTINGIEALVCSQYFPILNQDFKNKLQLALENKSPPRIYDALYLKKNKPSSFSVEDDSNNQYVRLLNSKSKSVGAESDDFYDNFIKPVTRLNDSIHIGHTETENQNTFYNILKYCKINRILARIADILLSNLSDSNTDIVKKNISYLIILLENKNTHPSTFREIKQHPRVPRSFLIYSKHCPSEVFRELANNADAILGELADSEDDEAIRSEVELLSSLIKSPNAPFDIILKSLKCLNNFFTARAVSKKISERARLLAAYPDYENRPFFLEILKTNFLNISEQENSYKQAALDAAVDNPKVQKILTACFLYANQNQRMNSSSSAAVGYY